MVSPYYFDDYYLFYVTTHTYILHTTYHTYIFWRNFIKTTLLVLFFVTITRYGTVPVVPYFFLYSYYTTTRKNECIKNGIKEERERFGGDLVC